VPHKLAVWSQPTNVSMSKPTILVTGAGGQIGTVLTNSLRKKYGRDQVIATDIRPNTHPDGIFEQLDIMDKDRLKQVILDYKITQIYHLVAILSAKGEKNPLRTWQINMDSLFNVLEAAKTHQIQRIFFPSSIAAFGPNAPAFNTPQLSYLDPTTVYGISKVAAENWCNYYFLKYGLDIRSLRYPGIISYQSAAGGGTTDYAVDIFRAALDKGFFSCFLKSDTKLPMIYMEDAVRATLDLMECPSEQINIRTSYNLAGLSFTPAEIAAEIQKHVPDFNIQYNPDFRQAIADSWPASIDDSAARHDWGWKPKFDLAKMTSEMIRQLKNQKQLI